LGDVGHLVSLPGAGRWAFWRCTALRAAGFPVAAVTGPEVGDCGAAAQRLLLCEEELEWLRNQASIALRGDIRRSSDAERRALRRVRRRLEAASPCHEDLAPLNAATRSAVEAYQRALEQRDSALRELREAFERAGSAVTQSLRRIAATARFQEAVLWQNRRGFHTGVERLLASGREDFGSSAYRRREELVARYLQRYGAKNDTIGFFGPVGWAWWSEEDEVVRVRVHPEMLCDRKVCFEGWTVDALAERMTADPALRSWLPPRILPFVKLGATSVRRPFESPRPLSATEAAALAACDGRRPARTIAEQLAADPASDVEDPQEVLDLFDRLRDEGVLSWGLEIPLEAHPERTLRAQLEAILDLELRDGALADLDELDAARRRVGEAAGDPQRLDESFESLEECFTRLTGQEPTRAAGRTYAARTLVYEDCRRHVDVRLGKKLLATLAPPLELVLDSSRWLSCRVAEEYRRAFEEVHLELAERSASSTVEMVDFWFQAQHLIFGARGRPLDRVLESYQQLWAELLGIRPGSRRVQLSSEKLGPRVRAAFRTSGIGWPGACHHSPDLMISSPSVEALAGGDFQIVMGELHVATNTLNSSVFVEQHPRPEELVRAVARDVTVPRVLSVTPKNVPRATTRTNMSLVSPRDYLLVTSADAAGLEGARVLKLSELQLERRDGRLRVRTHDGRLEVEPVECFALILSLLLALETRLLPAWDHTPRVTVDRLVMARETWRFAGAELTFADEKDAFELFVKVRRWAAGHGMPRFVFTRTSSEIKPMFVDFDNPLYVAIFAKEIRRAREAHGEAARVSASEMLPAPDQTWLPDAEGQTYTSELRIVAVDLTAAEAPPPDPPA